MPSHALRIPALLVALALAGCSTPAATGGPGSTNSPVGTPSGTPAGQATGPLLAGDPCSYLSAAEIAAVVGTVPVSVEERAGRGDCDYFMNADETAKVNVGLFEWAADGESVFETTKGFGDPVSLELGDDAYSIYNESIGTLVLVRAGDSLLVVQAFNTGDQAAQLDHATKLAQALFDKI